MADGFTSYEVDNDMSFRNALKRASAVSNDLRVPFGLILKDFYKSEQSIFKLRGPGKYPPFFGKKDNNGMTKYQAAKKRAVGFDYPLLIRSGKLAASVLGPNNPGSISLITKLTLVFGTSIKYGIFHQSDAGRKSNLPQRKFLFIGPESSTATDEQMGRLQRWLGYIEDHITREIRKAGLRVNS